MTDQHRDRRIDGASDLRSAIDALSQVDDEAQRRGFIHDRLTSAIDDFCKGPKGASGQAFTAKQVIILKDIAYHIVYLLGPRSPEPKGFIRSFCLEWKALSAMKKISAIGAVVLFFLTVGGAAIGIYAKSTVF